MRRILHSRLLRCIVCFCLICCIFVNCSPIRAKAVVPESILVGAGIVIGSILLGLGVGMGQDSTQQVLTNLVNDCVDVIKSDYDFIDEDALIQVYADYSAETARYYASRELVEAVQTWMFESETLKYISGTTVPEGYAYYNGYLLPVIPASDYPQYIYRYNDSKLRLITVYTSSPLKINTYGTDSYIGYANDCNELYYDYLEDSSIAEWRGPGKSSGYGGIHISKIIWISEDASNSDGSITMEGMEPSSTLDSYYESLVEGIALGHVANPDDDLPTGYPVWSGGAISIPGSTADEDERTGYPIGIADSLSGTLGLSQEDVWAGKSTYTGSSSVPGTDTETGTETETKTLADILAGVKAIPKAIADAVADAIAAVKAIPAEVAEATKAEVTTDLDGLSLDLKDFFPFCIPFDLYAFFGCLNAAPEAPVFELALPTPFGSYSFTVDLSPYDSVAEICRKLQLLLFCIGLAFETRNLIKG